MPVTWKEPGKIGFYAYFYAFNAVKSAFSVRRVIKVHNTAHRALRPQLIWKLAKLSCARITETGNDADATYVLQIDTHITGSIPWPMDSINGRCLDISKKRVQDVFYDVFGYELAVDPLTYEGNMVVKSDRNATHDGKVVVGPLAGAEDNKVYEKLIDNTSAAGTVVDLRACVIGKEIPFVYVKQRPVNQRFSNYNSRIYWSAVEQIFSESERELILRFTESMHLDIGELDVLRDRADGRIYIVDVAKTPHSPSNYYLTVGGIRCMHRAAAAFQRQWLGASTTNSNRRRSRVSAHT